MQHVNQGNNPGNSPGNSPGNRQSNSQSNSQGNSQGNNNSPANNSSSKETPLEQEETNVQLGAVLVIDQIHLQTRILSVRVVVGVKVVLVWSVPWGVVGTANQIHLRTQTPLAKVVAVVEMHPFNFKNVHIAKENSIQNPT